VGNQPPNLGLAEAAAEGRHGPSPVEDDSRHLGVAPQPVPGSAAEIRDFSRVVFVPVAPAVGAVAALAVPAIECARRRRRPVPGGQPIRPGCGYSGGPAVASAQLVELLLQPFELFLQFLKPGLECRGRRPRRGGAIDPGPGTLRCEGAEVDDQGVGLGGAEAVVERRHARALTLADTYRELGVRPHLVPGRVREVGQRPHATAAVAPAVDAMTPLTEPPEEGACGRGARPPGPAGLRSPGGWELQTSDRRDGRRGHHLRHDPAPPPGGAVLIMQDECDD
jgi:hypothetical protein